MSKPATLLGILCLVLLSIIVYLLLPAKHQNVPPPLTRIEIPTQVAVPEPRTAVTVSGLAIPKTVVESIPGSVSKVRTFEVVANADTFSVDKIAAYQDDIVHINLTAIDKQYDFTINKLGLSQTFAPGRSKVIEFQAMTTGTYTFSCTTCVGTKKTKFEGSQPNPQGVLFIVAAKS